jgi:hypothetical protein
MAKLSTNQRDDMPTKEFAGPGRSYPIPDKAHAANAKARASQQFDKGNLSGGAKATIDAKANTKLGKPVVKPKTNVAPAKMGAQLKTWKP